MNDSLAIGVVLLVEDEGLLRTEIACALRDAGWLVLEATSGERATLLLQSEQQIDVIFTDIKLAGTLTGWDVAERGRASQPAMPVIYTSGNAVDRWRRVQNSLFLEKPYNFADVVAACRQYGRV